MTDDQRSRCSAGQTGRIQSVETRAKHSAAGKGKTPWNKGIPISEEARVKDSASNMGRVAWNKGIPMTDEQKAELSAARKAWAAIPENGAKLSVSLSMALKGRYVGDLNPRYNGGLRASAGRHHAKRRVLGFISLNEPFDGCQAHHVDRERVIHIPEELHRSVPHNIWTGRNMDSINAVAFAYLNNS